MGGSSQQQHRAPGGVSFVESLKYKTLRVGAKLLGVVVEVNERGMQISLPNGLKGTVTRAEASDPFRALGGEKKRARRDRASGGGSSESDASDGSDSDAAVSSDSDSDSELSDASDAEASLRDAFAVGQIVRCVVLRLDKGKSGGKRVELATRLSAVVGGEKGALGSAPPEGVNVPACVESVEDHGYVLSFGYSPGGSKRSVPARGFLPRKNAPSRETPLVVGSILDVVLDGKKKGPEGDAGSSGSSSVFIATADPRRVANAVTHESDATSMATLLPGMLVNARVREMLADGVSANFMTYFVATVDAFHVADEKTGAAGGKRNAASASPFPAAAASPSAAHAVGDRVRARILHVDAATKRVGLTLRPHLLNRAPGQAIDLKLDPEFGGTGGGSGPDASTSIKLGAVFEDAIVRRVDPSVGVLLELRGAQKTEPPEGSGEAEPAYATSGPCAYCHISDAADDRVDKLERRFKVGGRFKARVIGRRALDGVFVASLKPSVLNRPFFTLDELEIGTTCEGEVVALEPYGALVRLAPGLKALCPPNHISDVPGRITSAKVKEGARLLFKVLAVDEARGRALVTRKKALLKSELAIVSDQRSALPGTKTHGVVTGVAPYGVFVQLYGDARGLAGLKHLGLDRDQAPADAFQIGQCVRATVLGSNKGANKLELSLVDGDGDGSGAPGAKSPLDDSETAGLEFADASAILPPGTVLERCAVRKLDEETGNVHVSFSFGSDAKASGVLSAAHVSDCALSGAAFSRAIRAGDSLGPCVVLESKALGSKVRATLSRKRALVDAARRGALPSDARDVVVGACYPGYVAGAVAASGVFVRFGGRLTGLAPPSRLTDPGAPRVDPEEAFALGQTVFAKVVAVDATDAAGGQARISLSVAPSSVTGIRGGKRGGAADPELDAPLLRAVFEDVDAADALVDGRLAEEGDGEGAPPEGFLTPETAEKLRPGTEVNFVVGETKEYGVLADVPEVDAEVVGLLAAHQLAKGAKKGSTRKGVVLDVSRAEGVADIAARKGLVALREASASATAARTKRSKKASSSRALVASEDPPLRPGSEVDAIVELLKPEYAIVSLPDHGGRVAFVARRLLNDPSLGASAEAFASLESDPRLGACDGETRVPLVVAAEPGPGGRAMLCAPKRASKTADSETEGDRANGTNAHASGTLVAAGVKLSGTVREVQPSQATVALSDGRVGRLHATEVGDRAGAPMPAGRFPLDSIRAGRRSRSSPSAARGTVGSMLEVSTRRTPEEAREAAATAEHAGAGRRASTEGRASPSRLGLLAARGRPTRRRRRRDGLGRDAHRRVGARAGHAHSRD